MPDPYGKEGEHEEKRLYKKNICLGLSGSAAVIIGSMRQRATGGDTPGLSLCAGVYGSDGQRGEENISNPVLRGGDLYYSSHFWNEETQESSQKFYRRNLETGETVELPLDLTIEGAEYVYPTNGLSFDQENNMISLLNASMTDEEGNYSQKYFLLKFDPEEKNC